MPSKPTSQPAASTNLRASEFSSRIGFELLMCTYIRRFTLSWRNAEIDPSGPETEIWPMRLPVLFSRPWVSISSSVKSVPSKKIRSAPRMLVCERRVDLGAAWNIEKRFAGFGVGDFEADRVAVAAAEIAAGVAFLQKERDFAGYGEGFDRQAEIDAAAFEARRLIEFECDARNHVPEPDLKIELAFSVARTRSDRRRSRRAGLRAG